MADDDHLLILERGVGAWNAWRKLYPLTRPDLSRGVLRKVKLESVDLRYANLHRANLSNSILSNANLSNADLSKAVLTKTLLLNADLSNANLFDADLSNANLSGATLRRARLNSAHLANTNFRGAAFGSTTFCNNDLSLTKGLNAARHFGPSDVCIDTLYASGGRISEEFLRGCGIPDSFIAFVPSLVEAEEPIQFYSCFISYSSKDQAFANKLYANLQQEKVRCWFAPEDMKVGDKIRHRIDDSIRLHDKVLLVLSKTSVTSQWVEQEVETALERERNEERLVLFPVRLDNVVMDIESGWPALIKNTRHIGDFLRWKSRESYQKSFERLLRDLRA